MKNRGRETSVGESMLLVGATTSRKGSPDEHKNVSCFGCGTFAVCCHGCVRSRYVAFTVEFDDVHIDKRHAYAKQRATKNGLERPQQGSVEATLPTGYSATAGSVVPNTLKIQPIPEKTAKDVPSLKSYDFAVLQGKVLIVNPSDKKIVDVITG